MPNKEAANYCIKEGCRITDVSKHFKITANTFRRWYTARPEVFKGLVNQYILSSNINKMVVEHE